MATFDYVGLLADADSLMDEFGQAGTILVPSTRTGDAWNPTVPADAPHACVLVEIDYTQAQIDGTQILATDKRILIKAGDLTAAIMSQATSIRYNGSTFKVVQPVKQINPAGINMLWDLQARA